MLPLLNSFTRLSKVIMFQNTHMIRAVQALVVISILTAGLLPAQAQQKTASVKQTVKKPKTQAELEMQNYFQKLDKSVVLPDVPDIGSHAKFRFGLQRTDASGVTSVGLRYGTTSTTTQVIDFYKTALIAQKWKLSSVSGVGIQATKADKSLNICMMPRGGPDVITDFMVNLSYKSR